MYRAYSPGPKDRRIQSRSNSLTCHVSCLSQVVLSNSNKGEFRVTSPEPTSLKSPMSRCRSLRSCLYPSGLVMVPENGSESLRSNLFLRSQSWFPEVKSESLRPSPSLSGQVLEVKSESQSQL
ncbi:Hypothetical predicted protein [Xyrichtys novacula]|uniref:Uncharacterized protein n=1 Tax=Xyrichtys novacula TaxID=13765 RepID=A0AAV1GM04_XYRNO|nr:Hypothetical predicted protein [Xyrichtys novacula]